MARDDVASPGEDGGALVGCRSAIYSVQRTPGSGASPRGRAQAELVVRLTASPETAVTLSLLLILTL